MIRTTLSFCALFGSLILVSKWLHETSRPQPSIAPAKASQSAPPQTSQPQTSQPQVLPSADPSVGRGGSASFPKAEPRPSYREAHASRSPSTHVVSYEEDLTEKIGDTEEPADLDLSDLVPADTSDKPRPKITTLEDLLLDDFPNDKQPAQSDAEAETADDPAEPGRLPTLERPSKSAEPELTLELVDLKSRLRNCLAWYYFRPENVASRSPWGSMHWMLAYGVDSQLIVGTKRVNAIGYLNYNGVCNGQRLFYLNNGKLQAQVGVGVQGHAGQYLAMLAQSRVKPDYPMLVDGQKLTVADLIEHEKQTCRPASELTFKLIALTHYLKSDEKWNSNDGQSWDIPRLIKEELAQPINGAACGGTHRLTGFSYAVRKREQRKEPLDGQWKRAAKYIEDFHEYTFKLQNADASFSTEWFVTRADSGDIGRRVQTTGHIVEWLAFSLKKEQLTEPRMIRSVSYLTDVLNENRQEKWSIGPLGHALHALAIYDERVFGGQPGTREEALAEIRKLQLQR
jgi:hypothetical protein